MIIKVFLMGGVGNQLFQINRALSLKLEGRKVSIVHLGIYKRFINLLIRHTTHENWIDINNLTKKLNLNYQQINFYDLIFLCFLYFLKKINLYNEFDTPLIDRLCSKKKFDIGYFQKKQHFSRNSLEILLSSLINLLNLDKNYLKNFKNKIAIFHVRGGDFMKNKNNKTINKRPNFKFINDLMSSFIKKNINFFIITNDKKIFKNQISYISEDRILCSDELSDFIKLTNCNLMYVSQSSFCFWAYLISKKLYNCEIINNYNWVYKDLI